MLKFFVAVVVLAGAIGAGLVVHRVGYVQGANQTIAYLHCLRWGDLSGRCEDVDDVKYLKDLKNKGLR